MYFFFHSVFFVVIPLCLLRHSLKKLKLISTQKSIVCISVWDYVKFIFNKMEWRKCVRAKHTWKDQFSEGKNKILVRVRENVRISSVFSLLAARTAGVLPLYSTSRNYERPRLSQNNVSYGVLHMGVSSVRLARCVGGGSWRREGEHRGKWASERASEPSERASDHMVVPPMGLSWSWLVSASWSVAPYRARSLTEHDPDKVRETSALARDDRGSFVEDHVILSPGKPSLARAGYNV